MTGISDSIVGLTFILFYYHVCMFGIICSRTIGQDEHHQRQGYSLYRFHGSGFSLIHYQMPRFSEKNSKYLSSFYSIFGSTNSHLQILCEYGILYRRIKARTRIRTKSSSKRFVIANGRTTVPKTTDRPKFKQKHKDKPF